METSEIKRDIFISYRNDGSGDEFASRLSRDLKERGFSVYFNPEEQRTHNFQAKILAAVQNCKDFILILSKGCLEGLINNEPVDWVREEILEANRHNKHIIPILMKNVEMPKDKMVMPESLRFLPDIDALSLYGEYLVSPFSVLIGTLNSKNDGKDKYRDTFNANPGYKVCEDLSQLRLAAQAGDVGAMYELGQMYYYGATNEAGTDAQRDFEKAAYWLNQVAESSDEALRCHALSTIARMYYSGAFPREPQSYEKAFQYHSEAAEQDACSVANVGFMLREGIGCDFDFSKVLGYYKEKYLQHDDATNMALADFLTRYGRFQEAIEVYDSLRDVSPEANYRIGMLYRRGVMSDPPRPDYFRAAFYLRKAADKNHVLAAYEYGMICFLPTSHFPKDFQEAETYLKIAADGGYAQAQYLLGFMYEYGHVKKDLVLAVDYLEKARAQSHSQAALELATIYQQPECQNYQKAYECAKTAASHGAPEGELILANLLFWGRGCEADVNKAYEMYSRAYQHGMHYASVMMKKIDALGKQ